MTFKYAVRALWFYLLLLSTNFAVAKDINIISWWGYLKPEHIEPIEQACGVNIHVDEYYSNPEFLRRVNKFSYDIAVYSELVYELFQRDVQKTSIALSDEITNQYLPDVSKLYKTSNYDPSTVYFLFAISGFLWNEKRFQLDQGESLETLFERAKGKTVVMLDEPVETMNLLAKLKSPLSSSSTLNNDLPTASQANELARGTNVVISSSLGNLLSKPDFAFAYTWSGEAIEKISQSKNPEEFKFMVHKNLSHWSKDLLTALTTKQETLCVAKLLAGPKLVNQLANQFYYFSPYLSYNASNKAFSKQGIFRDVYLLFSEALAEYPQIERPTTKNYEKIDREWQAIKMTINNSQ